MLIISRYFEVSLNKLFSIFNKSSFSFYEEYTGQLKRIDHHAHHLIFDDGTRLIIQNIRKIKRDLLLFSAEFMNYGSVNESVES